MRQLFFRTAMVTLVAHTVLATDAVTFIGVSHQTLTPERAAELSLGGIAGSEIIGIEEGGPASKSGLQVQDIVVGVNDLSADDAAQFTAYIQHIRPGILITLTVIRNSRRIEVPVVTGSRWIDPRAAATGVPASMRPVLAATPQALIRPSVSSAAEAVPTGLAYVGVRARDLTPERADELRITPRRGAEITRVEEGSPASKTGILIGDVILAYETATVRDANDLQTFIQQTPAGSLVRFGIMRQGQRIVVPVQTSVRNAEASVVSSTIPGAIFGCIKGAGIVLTAELGFTALVCGAEAAVTGETSLCESLLDAVLDDAPGRAIKACMTGSNISVLSGK